MYRSLILAALFLGACTPESSAPTADPQLTSLSSLDPWVRVKCSTRRCTEAVLTTDAVSNGTITWTHPDGTTTTGTTATVTAPDPDSPIVIEVEVAYDDGTVGDAAVAIAATLKRNVLAEDPGPATKMIVAEVQGNGCGLVQISSIGGCFDGEDPFTFNLWEGLADPTSAAPLAGLVSLSPATFDPSMGDAVSAGSANGAKAFDVFGAVHEDPIDSGILPIAQVPPYMTIQIDQAVTPSITVLGSGSTGANAWVQTEALTFECSGNDPFTGLATIQGN